MLDKKINENLMGAVFRYLAISILFMFIGFMVGQMFVPASIVYAANRVFLVLLIVLLVMSLFSKKGIIPSRFSMKFVYLFTFIQGILMYPLLQYYLQDLGIGVFISILLTTIILFSVLAYVSNNKEAGHYLGIGKTLLICLSGMIIASVVNLIIGGDVISIIISVIGVVLFSAYVLYDISHLKYEIENGMIQDEKDLSIHVLNLYLDFINILLDLLRIASSLDDE